MTTSCHACGATKCDLAKAGEPCWGRIRCVDESGFHACEGHEEIGRYKTHNCQCECAACRSAWSFAHALGDAVAGRTVRCSHCRHWRPEPDLPGWGSCDRRWLPAFPMLRDPVWSGQYERECEGYEP